LSSRAAASNSNRPKRTRPDRGCTVTASLSHVQVARGCPCSPVPAAAAFEAPALRGRKAVVTETDMPRVTTLAATLVFTLAVSAARGADAQTLPTLKVVSDSAAIHVRPAVLSETVKKADAGTMLEAIDREDDWYWVILPADEHGTRYPGWVRAHDVEIVAAGEPRAVLRHFVEAVEQAK